MADKNKPKHNRDWIESLIPLGMFFGVNLGLFASIFTDKISMGFGIAIGSALGLLVGTILYVIYSNK